jgi:DNA-binding NtrC family response regulator
MSVMEIDLNLAKAERRVIMAALVKHEGKRAAMAADLGISERTLYRKLHEHKLHDYYGEPKDHTRAIG